MAGVNRGDHHQCGQVVDHRERQQKHSDPGGRSRRQQGHESERERGVGRHRRTPSVGAGAPGVERQIDQDRHRDAADRPEHRNREPPPLAQLTEIELTLGLEADD